MRKRVVIVASRSSATMIRRTRVRRAEVVVGRRVVVRRGKAGGGEVVGRALRSSKVNDARIWVLPAQTGRVGEVVVQGEWGRGGSAGTLDADGRRLAPKAPKLVHAGISRKRRGG